MDNLEKETFSIIAMLLGEMAEAIIKSQPPFNDIPIQVEACSYRYSKLLQYFNEIEHGLQEKVILCEIDTAKFGFLKRLGVSNKKFMKEFPHHMETRKKFNDWVTIKELGAGADNNISGNIKKGIKVAQIIKDTVKQRMPGFSHKKIKEFPGVIAFEKQWREANALYLLIDKGTKRDFLDFSIGVKVPRFWVDISNFFAGSQSKYRYHDASSLEKSVNNALFLIDALLPHFIKTVDEALNAKDRIE